MARNLTIRLDDITEEEMRKCPRVNWNEIALKAIKEYIASREDNNRYDAAVKVHGTRGTYRRKTQEE